MDFGLVLFDFDGLRLGEHEFNLKMEIWMILVKGLLVRICEGCFLWFDNVLDENNDGYIFLGLFRVVGVIENIGSRLIRELGPFGVILYRKD